MSRWRYEVTYEVSLPGSHTDLWHTLKQKWIEDQTKDELDEFLNDHAEDSQSDLIEAIEQELTVFVAHQYELGNPYYNGYVQILHDQVDKAGVNENVMDVPPLPKIDPIEDWAASEGY